MHSFNRWDYETTWQEVWEHSASTIAVRRPDRPKWFIVELPPFANGEIHLGHVRNYTIGDAIARFRRMAGYDVLYTTGFDAFGLPIEKAAREAGVSPASLAEQNIASMRVQFRRLGYSHDRTRILGDHEPRYYRWVQWVFLSLLRHNLVYRRRGQVNWCGTCGSTISDGLLDAGCCWRCGQPVEAIEMDRWFIRETDLAQMLGESEPPAHWPKAILAVHQDWVGRKEGYEVALDVCATGSNEPIAACRIFLADLAELVGASSVTVPKDHPVVDELGLSIPLDAAARGAPTPFELLSPVDGSRLPLLVSVDGDRVRLGGSGPPGAAPGVGASTTEWERPEQAKPARRMRLRDWDIARPRPWGTPVPVIHCAECGPLGVPEAELPVRLPDFDLDENEGNPLERIAEFVDARCPRCGGPARRDTDTLEAYSSPWWYYLICGQPDLESDIFKGTGAVDWMPVDVMIGGSDQARTCFFHIRTMTAALNRMGITDEATPVRTLLATGMVKQDGRKMSKSAGNATSPTELIDAYGADALRVAVLWAAAPDQDYNWQPDLIRKASALLRRLRLFVSGRGDTLMADGPTAAETRRGRQLRTWTQAAAIRATDSLSRNAFHVALDQVATLVERLAAAERASVAGATSEEDALRDGARTLLLLIAPFAPHLAEELWANGGGVGLLSEAAWPIALQAPGGATA